MSSSQANARTFWHSAKGIALSRIAAAIMGGWAFTYGFVAVCTLVAMAVGLRFFEGQSLARMLSFTVYLAAILWGFAARKVSRVWLVLGGGGIAMMLVAWVAARAMV